MLDLLLWSGSLGDAPLAIGLAWRLFSGIAGRIGPASPDRADSSHTPDIDSARLAARARPLCRRVVP